MDKPKVVYVTYINTTPEKVWNALIDGEMTKLYWGHSRNVSDWQVGSMWTHEDYADRHYCGQSGMAGNCFES